MNWQPIEQYRPEMGHVLVWLQWPEYSRPLGCVVANGDWLLAYQVVTKGGPVWVEAKDSIPCETTGRCITHFMQKVAP